MTKPLRPDSAEQAMDAVRQACADARPLEVATFATKRALGHAVRAETCLDLSGLAGIGLYEPEELVMTVGAGTPLADVEAALAEKNQHLAFEPQDLGALLGGAAGGASVAGMFSCNLSGPRRILSGAARDHILGFRAINGRGEAFKSGGRVVKNVTGFDLSKLMCGAHGTLAVLTELTFKVLPKAEKARTVLVAGLPDGAAMAALGAAVNSSNEVSGAAHLPAALAARSAVAYVSGAGAAVTAVRVEGPGPSVAARCAALTSVLAPFGGALEELHTANTETLWREIRDARLFAGAERQIWRLSVAPSDGAAAAAAILSQCAGEAMFDWGGGLVWLALDASPDAHAGLVRGALAGGGHATLIRAGAAARAAVPVFQPPSGPLAVLTKRVKDAFDPAGILNPGRMG